MGSEVQRFRGSEVAGFLTPARHRFAQARRAGLPARRPSGGTSDLWAFNSATIRA